MIKVIGFHKGLFGDLVMNTVSCRTIKELYPDCHLTFAVGKEFKSILPLFEQHPHIDNFHIWQSDNDESMMEEFRKYVILNNFDICFPPLPKHQQPNWYLFRHYINETLNMNFLPQTHDLQCYLNPWFGKDDKYKNYVTISAFPSKSGNLSKTLSLEKWADIVKVINSAGYKCLQLGGKFDIQIEGAEKPDLDWVGAAQALYSSKLQITCDTSWSWIGSAYQCNVIGLFGLNYPDMKNPWSHMPVNPNTKYLWGTNVDDIPLDIIINTVKLKLNK